MQHLRHLAAEHADQTMIAEVMHSTSSENDLEQLAREASVDDTVPRRALRRDMALPAPVDTTTETNPAVTDTTSTHHLHCTTSLMKPKTTPTTT